MWQFARFIIVGVWNTLLGFAVIFFCMRVMRIDPYASNAIGYGVGLLNSFYLNRNFTFRSNDRISGQFFRFILAFLVAYAINFAALKIALDVMNIDKYVSQILAAGTYVFASYLLNRAFVFGMNGSTAKQN